MTDRGLTRLRLGAALIIMLVRAAGAAGQGDTAPLADIDKLLGLQPVAATQEHTAQSRAQIGIADLAVAFIFHPAMVDYVTEERNFARPVPESASAAERKAILGQRYEEQKRLWTQFQDIKNKAYLMDREWQKRKSDAYGKLTATQQRLSAEMKAKAAKAERGAEGVYRSYDKAFKDAETAYWTEVGKIEVERNDFNKQFTALTEKIVSVSMLTRRELIERVQGILSDISEAVKKAQERYNLSIVVNRAFLSPRGVPELVRLNPFDRFPGDISMLTNLYREFLRSPDGAASLNVGKDPFLTALAGSPEGSPYLRHWYARMNDNSLFYQASALNQLVISGGVDITPYVVAEVMGKHGVSPEKIKVVVGFVQSLGRESFEPGSQSVFSHARE